MSSRDKSWSVAADKMGAHWQVTVRRGQEGSRALLGKLTFDLSDAEDVKDRIEGIAARVAIRATSLTIQKLAEDGLLRCENGPALQQILLKYDEAIIPQCCEVAIDQMQKTFGVRVDLAGIKPDPMNGPCPPGFLCIHEGLCPGCRRE